MNLTVTDFEILRPVEFYQMGNMTLWSNEYIAKNVLKKHLNEYIDSGTRKLVTVKKTVDWISELLSENAQILDVGCGPGIYAPFFCENGFLYEGIDVSPYQIDYAKGHNFFPNRTTYTVCDFREWDSEKKYDVCLFLYGIYSFYNSCERIAFLKRVKRKLKKGGFVVIELFTKKHYLQRENSTDWAYIEKGGFWCDQPHLELNAFYKYSKESIVLIQAATICESIKVWNSWITMFDKRSISEELRMAGFEYIYFYGSCYGMEYKDDSEVICVIAK